MVPKRTQDAGSGVAILSREEHSLAFLVSVFDNELMIDIDAELVIEV